METQNNQMPQYSNNGYGYNGQTGTYTPVGAMQHPINQFALKAAAAQKEGAEHFKKYGILSAMFGIIYSICLYNNHSSITYPIFMLCALIILKLVRKKDGLSLTADCNGKRGLGIFYVVSLMLLSVHRCLTTSFALAFWERTAIFMLFFSYVIYLYMDTTGFSIGEWFLSLFLTVIMPFEHFSRPFSDFVAHIKLKNKDVDTSEKKKTVCAVLIGLAIAVPLLLVIVPLLCSADMVFKNILTTINIDFSLTEELYHTVMMVLTAVFVFLSAYAIITSMIAKELKIKISDLGKKDPVIAITFTGIIGIVYLLFCIIQLLYLFSGSIALPKGYTYAQYAHEGFYQLLAVCIINIIMVSICQAFFKESKLLKALLTTIAGCTYIMIASSAMRMILYIDVYHLTFLRLFVLWFLAVLCFWLAFLIASMYIKKFPVFKAGMVTITIAFLIFIYSNPEYRIAKYDIEASGSNLSAQSSDVSYIKWSLSYDAVPALAGNEMLINEYKDGRSDYDYRTDDKKKYTGFRRFNISYNLAQKYLK
ncbi:MAG: DUF4173 domain-containing protein [Butyrivibrio sp.]|nr:DUF4173 domain-containing protein [Butyrivibrio sp.]